MVILFASAVLDLIGFGLMLPLLPFYAQAHGASPFVVTMLAAAFSIAQLAASPLVGRLSDRHGRKPVFLGCLALSVVGYVWLGLADDLVSIFLARIVAGVSAGKLAVTQAIVADITTPDRRARGMGMIGAAFGIGMIAGPVAGALLIGDPANPNYALPAFAAAVASAVALAFALVMLKESRPAAAAGPVPAQGWSERLRLMRGHGPFLHLAILAFLIFFVFSQIEVLFPLWTGAILDWGPHQVGLSFTLIGVIVIVIQGGLIGPLTRRLGERRVLALGLGLLAIGAAGSVAVTAGWQVPVTILFTAAGFGLINPSLNAHASRLADPARLGAIMGVLASAGALGRVLGPGWGGWLFETFGPRWPYGVSAAILVASLALIWPGTAVATPSGKTVS